jgi:hypothetical protein
MKTVNRMIAAFLVGAFLTILPFAVERTVAYRPLVYQVSDALWLPGALVARIFYPAGIHTGRGSVAYVPLATSFNFFIYFGLAFAVLLLARPFRPR